MAMTFRTVRRGFGLTLFVVLLVVLAYVLARPYAVSDWLRLRNYEPTAEIAALVTDTAMTGTAKHLFYINRPMLLDKPSFAQACPNADNQTIIIGCYLGGQRGIHVLDVSDERLAGVEQVTAAHEMLHAAYDRLSRAERTRVDALLQDYADNGLADERIKSVLVSYQTTEPGQQHNEMHSIFGTEIANLPEELETYYRQYFDDRSQVTTFASHYQEAFTSRQAALRSYDEQLKTLNSQIDTNTSELEGREKAIKEERQQLDRYRASGDIERYNAGVDAYNASIGSYNGMLEQTRQMISRYNAIVEQRNAIAAQSAELQQAINSGDLPASQ